MKIQTGLRIPEGRYVELRILADKMGVSLNAYLLMLIDLGAEALNRQKGDLPSDQQH